MPCNDLFRQKNLDALNDPEHIDEHITVTKPSVYIVVATLAVMILSVIIWGIIGTITDKATVGGVMFPTQGTTTVTLPNRGTVRSLFVHKGDHVTQNQSIAMVSVEDAYSMISSPQTGTVLNVLDENKSFEAFEPIATIIASEAEQQREVHTLIAFVPFELMRKMRVGMDVEATPKNLTREKDGYVKGRITRIEQYPITREQAIKKMRVEGFANDIFPEQGSAFEVEMELEDLQLADTELSVGTFLNIQVITRKRSVYQYMFEK